MLVVAERGQAQISNSISLAKWEGHVECFMISLSPLMELGTVHRIVQIIEWILEE